jgi:hypothetical protein
MPPRSGFARAGHPHRDLAAVLEAELREDVLHVVLGGSVRDVGSLRDLHVRETLRHERGDLQLACTEDGDVATPEALERRLRPPCERLQPEATGQLEAAAQQRPTFTLVVGRSYLDQHGAEATSRLGDLGPKTGALVAASAARR